MQTLKEYLKNRAKDWQDHEKNLAIISGEHNPYLEGRVAECLSLLAFLPSHILYTEVEMED